MKINVLIATAPFPLNMLEFTRTVTITKDITCNFMFSAILCVSFVKIYN